MTELTPGLRINQPKFTSLPTSLNTKGVVRKLIRYNTLFFYLSYSFVNTR